MLTLRHQEATSELLMNKFVGVITICLSGLGMQRGLNTIYIMGKIAKLMVERPPAVQLKFVIA